MRKNIPLTICIILIISTISASSATLVETNNLTKEGFNYIFSFEEPTLQIKTIENSCYTNINIPGCIAMGREVGEPMMPTKFIQLLLPPQKTIANINVAGESVEIDLDGIDLKHSPVIPYQSPIPFGSKPEEFVINNDFYTSKSIHPSPGNKNYNIGYSHGYTILNMELNPIQYIPNEGKLFFYSELTVTINLKDSNFINQFYRNNQVDETWVKSLVWNPEITESYTTEIPTFDYPGGLCDPSDCYDYVIITTAQNSLDYWQTSAQTPYNWESLMEKHEEDDDLSCTIVTIQDIDDCEDYYDPHPLFNDLEAHIREFCKDAYQDWGTSYIFVGGDAEWIPARLMKAKDEQVDSDIYWSNLDNTFNDDEDSEWGEEGDDGFDLYAELFIGRITCDVPQDVSNWMTKSFYYADVENKDYLENGGFYAGDSDWDCEGDDFIDFCAIKGTDDWLGPDPHSDGPWPTWLGFLYGFETWNNIYPDAPGAQYNLSVKWTAEPPNPGWKGGGVSMAIAGFREAINANHVTIISGVAHANKAMSLDVDMIDWESKYHNTRPFFIHDHGCHNGDMDAADDGVLHSMLFHSDKELAFGCVYNTGFGYGNFVTTNSSSALQAKLFWDYFLDVTNNSGSYENWQLGKAQAWSKDVMAPTINWDKTWRTCIQSCLLFADPAQRLKPPGSPPETPEKPLGPSEGITKIEYIFSSNTTEPEGDEVFYKFDWGDCNCSDWLGPYSPGTICEASYSWDYPSDFEIHVKAKDSKGADSGWSDSHIITIIEGPRLEITGIHGGLFRVSASIANVGIVDAEEVQWVINLEGGVFFGKEKSGVQYIPAGNTRTIISKFILGFGSTIITVTADVVNGGPDIKKWNGFIFLFFINIKPEGDYVRL